MSSREIAIEDLLPLPEATFHILMAVAEDDRHGYAIIQDVVTRTDGMLKLSPGTLYPLLARMARRGWLRATEPKRSRDARVYRITPAGAEVLKRLRASLAELQHEVGAHSASRARGRKSGSKKPKSKHG